MGEAAQNLEPATEPKQEATTPQPQPDRDDTKLSLREKLVQGLQKKVEKRERDELKAKTKAEPAKPKDPKTEKKEPPKREASPAEKDPKAPAPKDQKKAEPGKDGKPVEADTAEAAQPDEHQELKAQRRAFAKFQRKKEGEYAHRESQLTIREQRVQSKESTILEGIKRDPLKALRELGVDVRKELLSYVDEDNEDPRDKSLRELRETAESAQKTAKELKEEREREKGRSSFEAVGSVLRNAWEGFEPDEHPYLRALYEPGEIVGIARKVVLKHYADTMKATGQGVKLAPARVFAYLEDVEREEDERKQVARERRQTIGSKTDPESREQVPPVKAASPERRERATDVTNRATRIASFDASPDTETPEERRERLKLMVRERLRR